MNLRPLSTNKPSGLWSLQQFWRSEALTRGVFEQLQNVLGSPTTAKCNLKEWKKVKIDDFRTNRASSPIFVWYLRF